MTIGKYAFVYTTSMGFFIQNSHSPRIIHLLGLQWFSLTLLNNFSLFNYLNIYLEITRALYTSINLCSFSSELHYTGKYWVYLTRLLISYNVLTQFILFIILFLNISPFLSQFCKKLFYPQDLASASSLERPYPKGDFTAAQVAQDEVGKSKIHVSCQRYDLSHY